MDTLHRGLLDKLLSTCPSPHTTARLIEVWAANPMALWGMPLPGLQTNLAIEHYRIVASPTTQKDWQYVQSRRPVTGTGQFRVTGRMAGPGRQVFRVHATLQFNQAIVAQLAIPIVGTTAYATALWSERSEVTVRIGSTLGFMCMVESLYRGLSLEALRSASPMEHMQLYLARALPRQLLQAVS